jgi:hypothetical protein
MSPITGSHVGAEAVRADVTLRSRGKLRCMLGADHDASVADGGD